MSQLAPITKSHHCSRRKNYRYLQFLAVSLAIIMSWPLSISAQTLPSPTGNPQLVPVQPTATPNGLPAGMDPDQMLSPGGMSSTLKMLFLLTVLSLAPAIIMMTTCFIRIIVVLGFLRQALGSPQSPPNQVIIALSMFLTLMVMWPVWSEAYNEGIKPYSQQKFRTQEEQNKGLEQAMERTLLPVRKFMSDQISRTGNDSAVWLFLDYTRPAPGTKAAENLYGPCELRRSPHNGTHPRIYAE